MDWSEKPKNQFGVEDNRFVQVHGPSQSRIPCAFDLTFSGNGSRVFVVQSKSRSRQVADVRHAAARLEHEFTDRQILFKIFGWHKPRTLDAEINLSARDRQHPDLASGRIPERMLARGCGRSLKVSDRGRARNAATFRGQVVGFARPNRRVKADVQPAGQGSDHDLALAAFEICVNLLRPKIALINVGADVANALAVRAAR